MSLSADMFSSAGAGVVALLLGLLLTRRVPFLKRFCIPAPVSGGILVSLLTLLLYSVFGVEIMFDGTIKDICMMLFFTSVGFISDVRVLRKGGRPLLVLIALVAVLIVCQNLISVGIAKGMNMDPLFGMAAGSIPMSGGHGTAGGFSPLLEQMGLNGASSITMAAATFGLVAGSLLGGPLGEALIRRHKLSAQSSGTDVLDSIETGQPESREPQTEVLAEGQAGGLNEGQTGGQTGRQTGGQNEGQTGGQTGRQAFRNHLVASCVLIIAMALGTGLSKLLALTGITFPTYFGALLVACAMRNLLGLSPRLSEGLCVGEIISIGEICLQLFLGMAMASLRLWELASLALPLTLILLAQVAFMALYGAFVAFPLLGKNYDGAVLVSGLCGFGLGATPNAMANMSAVCYKYRYAPTPFIIVPIIGAIFVDIINTGVVTLLLNLIH